MRVTDRRGAVQQEVITVSDKTKQIADGVTARVVHDVVSEGGKPVEITDDWYAQDSAGNVWYFGEDTTEIHDGKRDTSGSFEAGVNGADAGVAMLAHPERARPTARSTTRATPRTGAGCSRWISRPRFPSATSGT